MNLELNPGQREKVRSFQERHRAGLLTLVFTDIVGSTRIKQQLGDAHGVDLILQHHAMLRALLAAFPDAEEISTAGDSFFLVFARPSDAVKFGLELIRQLQAPKGDPGTPLADRVGIHVGEVLIHRHGGEGEATDLYGIQIDVCSRLMSLASPNQILLSRHAFDLARQALSGRDLRRAGPLTWLNHGPYLLKGMDAPVEVCEVREGKEGPPPPLSTDKGRRLASEGEIVPGWRPAIDESIPGTRWVLEAKLGEGGFGEVWRGRHSQLKDQRVFKFCFQADRVRALKREMTLLRLLRDRVGEHPHVVRLLDVFLDEAPYYLEFEHAAGADLATACRQAGGPAAIPLEVRIEWVAQAAEGLQAAHEAGVVHRDIKPSNILVCGPWGDGTGPRVGLPASLPPGNVKLMDFGIGQVVSEEFLAGMTRAGFTETLLVTASYPAGTQLYLAPELLAPGGTASPRSDLYSLGVVLYQLLVGDLNRPLTTEWPGHIEDPLLREDLRLCLAGAPADRLASAAQLAQRLRSLPERRLARERERSLQAARERAAYRRGVARTATAAGLLLLLVGGLALWAMREAFRADRAAGQAGAAETAERGERLRAEAERTRARHLLASSHVERGNRLADEGDLHGALVWFAEALRLDAADSAFATIHRTRIASFLRDTPVPALTLIPGRTAPAGAPGVPMLHEMLSLNGRIYATLTPQAGIEAWDVGSGRRILSLPPASPEAPPVERLLVDPAGTALYWRTAGSWSGRTLPEGTPVDTRWLPRDANLFLPLDPRRAYVLQEEGLHVVERGTGRTVLTLTPSQNPRRFYNVTFDHNPWVARIEDRRIQVLSAETGQEVGPPVTARNEVTCVACDADATRIAIGLADGEVMLVNLATGEVEEALRRHTGWIQALTFSPDTRLLATAGTDRTVLIWDVATRRPLQEGLPHRASVISLRFSPDSQRLLTVSEDYSTRAWKVSTGLPETPWLRHGAQAYARFGENGRDILVVGQGLRVWSPVPSRQQPLPSDEDASLWTVGFDPRGGRAVLTQLRNRATVMTDGFQHRPYPPLTHEGRVSGARFTRDGTRVVTEGDDPRIWDSATGQPLSQRLVDGTNVLKAVIGPSGRRALLAFSDRSVQVWDPAAAQPVSARRPFPITPNSLQLSDDDRWWAAQTDLELTLWPVDGTSPEPSLRIQGRLPEDQGAFSPGSALLCVLDSSGNRERLRFFDLAKQAWWDEPGNEGWIEVVDFDPTGSRMAVGGYGFARLFDLRDRKPAGPRFVPQQVVRSLALAPDGRRIAIASASGITRIWNGESGKVLTPPMAHAERELARLFFSTDSGRLLTIAGSGWLRVWESVSGQPLGPAIDTGAEAREAWASPDLAFAVTRYQYLTRIWNLHDAPVQAPVEEIQRWTQALASARVDDTGALVPLEAEERSTLLTAGWHSLRQHLLAQSGPAKEAQRPAPSASEDLVLPQLPRSFTLIRGPRSQGVAPGGRARFDVEVSTPRSAPLAYQWRRNGVPLHGRTNAVLELEAITDRDHGSYSVVLSGPDGTLVSPAALLGAEAPDPDLAGQWDFENGTLAATVGWDLTPLPGSAGAVESGAAFASTADLGLPPLDGRPARVLRLPTGNRTVGYVLRHGIAPTTPNALINRYTLVMDVLYENPENQRFSSIVQIDDLQNRDDGDLCTSWTNRVGGIGITERYAGHSAIHIGRWHRLAFAIDAAAAEPVIAKYIDGRKHADQTNANGLKTDGRFSLRPVLFLFADENGELLPGAVNSVQIYRRPLTEEEIARLGGPTPEGLPVRLPAP